MRSDAAAIRDLCRGSFCISCHFRRGRDRYGRFGGPLLQVREPIETGAVRRRRAVRRQDHWLLLQCSVNSRWGAQVQPFLLPADVLQVYMLADAGIGSSAGVACVNLLSLLLLLCFQSLLTGCLDLFGSRLGSGLNVDLTAHQA